MKKILLLCAVCLSMLNICSCSITSKQGKVGDWQITAPASLQKARQAYLAYLNQHKIDRIYEVYCSDEISGNETDGWKIGEWVVTPKGERTLDLTLTVKDYSHYSEDTFIIEFDDAGNAKVKKFIPYE